MSKNFYARYQEFKKPDVYEELAFLDFIRAAVACGCPEHMDILNKHLSALYA